jgi:hypothetical protein
MSDERPPTSSDDTKLYVGNLSFKATSEDLEAHFSQFGNILDAFVVMDREVRLLLLLPLLIPLLSSPCVSCVASHCQIFCSSPCTQAVGSTVSRLPGLQRNAQEGHCVVS